MGTPERPPSPGVNPRKDSAPILRNLSPKIILAIMAVAAVTLIVRTPPLQHRSSLLAALLDLPLPCMHG